MVFNSFEEAVDVLSARYSLFEAEVKSKDVGAHVSMTQTAINSFELIVTNSSGNRDNYSFSILPIPISGFEIQCSRVVAC